MGRLSTTECTYLPTYLPLMSLVAQEYPQVAWAPHTSPAQAYVDDAVPMAQDRKAQQVVQDLMQRYGGYNSWSGAGRSRLS